MRFDPAKHPHTRDLTARRFGRLIVVDFAGARSRGPGLRIRETYWNCRCDCGHSTKVRTARLTAGHTTSCGCRQREAVGENGRKNRRHGRIKTPEYYAWASMKQRCLNPKYHHFENWGGRGIRICQRWIDSFEAFFADVGPKPSPDSVLDRIDNDKHYEPGNVRWATAMISGNNRRRPI